MVMGGLLIGSPGPAVAAGLSDTPFGAYGTGTAISVNALQLGTTQVANVQQATASAVVNSTGLNPPPSVNEMGQTVLPPGEAAKNAYARGSGAEVGALTNVPDPNNQNQLILSGLAQQDAPPVVGAPTVKQIGPVNLDPILKATVLKGTAQAVWDPNFCPVGVPFSYGRGEAAGAQVLTNATGGALVDTTGNTQGVSQSRSYTYLISNGDGTFGMVSETHMTVAPVTLASVGANLIQPATLELVGEFVLRVTATGKPGGASVTFAPAGSPSPTDPIVKLNGATVLTTQQLVGGAGLNVNVLPLLAIQLGVPPHPIGAASGAAPVAADGTSASGAVDLARIAVLNTPGLTGGDIRLAHAEGAVSVPAGGLKCTIPVSKTADPDPVTAGNNVTLHINIPADVNQFSTLFSCDLVGIKVVDTEAILSGRPSFTIVSADNGATISGNTVTFANGGNYHPGDPPRVLSIVLSIPGNSGNGVLQDTANVSAVLGNCTGGIAGQELVGAANINNAAVSGIGTLQGPTVTGGNLAATGGNSWPLVVGGGFLLAALGVVRLRRRVTDPTVTTTN
jgi:hypothetical protein